MPWLGRLMPGSFCAGLRRDRLRIQQLSLLRIIEGSRLLDVMIGMSVPLFSRWRGGRASVDSHLAHLLRQGADVLRILLCILPTVHAAHLLSVLDHACFGQLL